MFYCYGQPRILFLAMVAACLNIKRPVKKKRQTWVNVALFLNFEFLFCLWVPSMLTVRTTSDKMWYLPLYTSCYCNETFNSEPKRWPFRTVQMWCNSFLIHSCNVGGMRPMLCNNYYPCAWISSTDWHGVQSHFSGDFKNVGSTKALVKSIVKQFCIYKYLHVIGAVISGYKKNNCSNLGHCLK